MTSRMVSLTNLLYDLSVYLGTKFIQSSWNTSTKLGPILKRSRVRVRTEKLLSVDAEVSKVKSAGLARAIADLANECSLQ